MVIYMTATEAKTKLLALLDEVASTGDEVEITKHGRPVARLVPVGGSGALKSRLAGLAVSAAPDAELYGTGAEWDLP